MNPTKKHIMRHLKMYNKSTRKMSGADYGATEAEWALYRSKVAWTSATMKQSATEKFY